MHQPPGWPPQGPQQPWGAPPGYAPQTPQIPPGYAVCPACRTCAPPRVVSTGGPSGCLAIVLLFCGIVPGVLYLLFAGSTNFRVCANCGNNLGLAGESSNAKGCGIVLLALIAVGLVSTFVEALLR